MNLDRTFCTGKRCGKEKMCDRSMYTLKEWFKTSWGKGFTSRPISVSDFGDEKGNCKMFCKREDK